MKGYLKVTTLAFLSLVTLLGCGKNDSGLLTSPHTQREFLIGTIINLSVYDEDKEYTLQLAMDRISELEQLISEELNSTKVFEINREAGKSPVYVSDELYELIKISIDYGIQSDGGFDVTIGPLTQLWRIGFDDARKPGQDEIEDVLGLINHENVELDDENQTVYLVKEGMELDLGAIAKGYIADQVNLLLDEEGVTAAIIDLGGNIFVKGNRPSGGDWSVGIQNPFLGRGELVGKIKASDKSVVTSGIYERYLEVDDETYHHLLDPDTGYPFNNEIAGVSIISDLSVDGDALSTVAFAKGLVEGKAFIEELEDVEAIFVTRDRAIYLTSGIVDNFELVNENFDLITQ
ncbi:thiamine biosynthesis lipoprotein [Amphibacillus marinus]|uniref:FAD:protein FMN transferase n=1 Tax=Amphibacillus marinus TaxID=872970 RepID=A0A1H8TL54_9BACI|nr:FAD:protein FMN transferase [Amphibacillus marinus]SEO91702.1 thiamine biosynthesis lipoprotein [Amphibacillus marinus]